MSEMNRMKSWGRSAAAIFSAFFLVGCSLMTEFDPEGKPCDSYQKCEDGYQCQVTNPETGEGPCKSGGGKVASAILPADLSTTAPTADGVSADSADTLSSGDADAAASADDASQMLESGLPDAAGSDDIWDAPCEQDEDCADLDGYLCDTESRLCVPPA